ncbi:MAG: signal recognition particle-docking protein FtsY [Fusobacteriota bacterium]
MGIKKFFKGLGKNSEKEEIKQDIDEKINEDNKTEKQEEKKSNDNKINKEKTLETDIKTKNKEENKEENKEDKKSKTGILTSLKKKLFKSRNGLFGKLKGLFLNRKIIDDEMYEELEELLVQSDVGFEMTLKIVENLEAKVKEEGVKDPEKVFDVLRRVMEDFLIKDGIDLNIKKDKMNVILVVGVNGVGKTTTIGKMAMDLKNKGNKVVVGAADTFRAAAIEQLEEWTTRADVDIIKHQSGADPGAVVFDTLKAGRKKGADIVILDTAGRLHNKNNLMKELSKIDKIIKNELGEQSYESLLVIDGTTGQNALSQAKIFNEASNLTGFVITKLDGTAKGGIVFAVSEQLKKPVKYIGVGEGINDLRKFKPDEFVDAIFE